MKRFFAAGLLLLAAVPLAQAAEPESPAKLPTITNSIGMKLVLIPAGEFQMGGNETAGELVEAFALNKRPPEYFKDEYPKHRVRITRPFYFGQYEVTVGQFKQFTQDSGYKTEPETDGEGGWGFNREKGKCEGREPHFNWMNPGFPQTDNHPVLNVTWNDAVAFCQWLSKKEGETYRLPTEAEWEYACRAGTTTRFNCGDDPDTLLESANMDHVKGRTEFPHVQELELPKDKPVTFTMPVGSFKPNRFGLYDMHGNVWEWTADRYGEDYYANSPVDDPQGPDDGHLRVRRGGAWHSYPIWVRASFRNWNVPQSRCVNLGFRVVRNAEPRVSIVLAGDVMLDGDPGHAIAHGGDPFAEFADLLQKADVSVCNLECVLAPGGQQVLKPYTFRGPQKAVPLLKKYFSAVGVANNHTGDFGPEAFRAQLEMLEKAELPYFGGGRNAQEARRPLILERQGVRIALLAYNGFPPRSFAATEKKPGVAWLVEEQVLADIRAARTKQQADIVIPYLHWGVEETEAPTREQKTLARRLIDGGASAVIGHHPHVIQTVDVYKGRPIVYSLGNFVFDYFPTDPAVWIGWVVRLDCAKSGAVDLETFALQIDKAGTPHLLPEDDRRPPAQPRQKDRGAKHE